MPGPEDRTPNDGIPSGCANRYTCDDVDNGWDNTCVIFSTPETDYIIYD